MKHSRNEIACLLGDYNAIGLAARVDGEIAGFNGHNVRRKQVFGHILRWMCTVASTMGIAQMLEELEKLLRQKGVVECRFEVREGNAAAINLYLKLGYRKMRRLDKYYGDSHGFYLQKILNVTEYSLYYS
jgi:RimJ/RimL family protein N-acetyltransferase